MAEIFKFFNSAPGDERWHYASDFADYFGDVLSSGLIHKNNVPGLQVTVVFNSLKTRVDVGQALIKGYSYQNTTPIELSHDITEIGLNRIDRIVLRLDLRNANRYIKVFVKKGEEAVNPVPPTLQRDQYIHELSLAQVRVNSNSTIINPLSLVDERMNEDLCGIVHSLISVPTSVFQQQWDYWFNVQSGVYTAELLAWIADQKVIFNNWKVQEQSDFTTWSNTQKTEFAQWRSTEQDLFNAWFANLQTLLDENVAATLTAKVQSLEQAVTTHLDEDNEQAHAIGNISGLKTELNKIGTLSALQTTQKSNLVAAINEVKQIGNNVKSDTVDALLSLDDSLPITSESTWTDIITQIGNISTGKRQANGSGTLPTGGTNIPVRGLAFKPSVFLFRGTGTSNGGGYEITFIAVNIPDFPFRASTTLGDSRPISKLSDNTIPTANNQYSFTDNGFNFRYGVVLSEYHWIAIE